MTASFHTLKYLKDFLRKNSYALKPEQQITLVCRNQTGPNDHRTVVDAETHFLFQACFEKNAPNVLTTRSQLNAF